MPPTIVAETQQQKWNQEWYQRNKAKAKARALAWTARQSKLNRALAREAKSIPCTDCGIQYEPWVMQFDHVRGVKRFDIGSGMSLGYSTKSLVAEIFKCEVVCANCHADRTYVRRHAGD